MAWAAGWSRSSPACRSESPAGDLAIRQGPWKLIFVKNGRKELYNLADDLSETRNRAADKPDVVDRLGGLMQRYIADGRSTPGAGAEERGRDQARPARGKDVKDALNPLFD